MLAIFAATLTIIGTLGGVCLGSYLQQRSRQNEWRHEDRLRWLEERRSEYVRFIEEMHTANAMISEKHAEGFDAWKETYFSLQRRVANIELLAGSGDVVRVAKEYVALLNNNSSFWDLMEQSEESIRKGDPDAALEDPEKELAAWTRNLVRILAMPGKFMAAAREELGLSALDIGPIESGDFSRRVSRGIRAGAERAINEFRAGEGKESL